VIRKVFCNKFDRSTVSHMKKRVTNKSMPRDRAFLPYLSDCYPPFVFPSLSSPSKLESEGETTMVSSSLSPLSQFSSTNFTVCEKPTYRPKKIQIGCAVKPTGSSGSSSSSSSSLPRRRVLHRSLPLAASVIVLLSSNPGIRKAQELALFYLSF
jgi:hypothetical protein